MKSKPWQMVVIALGLLVGGGSLAYNLVNSGEVQTADAVFLVDVETGKLYRFSTGGGTGIMFPARRPDTKQIALVRVIKGEDGAWRVSDRDLSQLDHLDEGVKVAAVDPSTGKLLKDGGGPDRYVPPKLP
jgi:dipeptidyl aminopeptidase/acylaminoacyl peptidase